MSYIVLRSFLFARSLQPVAWRRCSHYGRLCPNGCAALGEVARLMFCSCVFMVDAVAVVPPSADHPGRQG